MYSYLDVHVHDAALVQVGEPLECLTHQVLDVTLAEAALALVDVTIQLAALRTATHKHIGSKQRLTMAGR